MIPIILGNVQQPAARRRQHINIHQIVKQFQVPRNPGWLRVDRRRIVFSRPVNRGRIRARDLLHAAVAYSTVEAGMSCGLEDSGRVVTGETE